MDWKTYEAKIRRLEKEVAEKNSILDAKCKEIEDLKKELHAEAPQPAEDKPRLIGCVQHDCAACEAQEAQMRRLEAENESFRIGLHHLRDNNVALRSENAALKADKAELLDVLGAYVTVIAAGGGGDKDLFMAAIREVDNKARAAIAKHGGVK